MIRIYVNNTLLDIDQKLTIEQNSPWFNDDIIGEFSYPMSGPMTLNNTNLLRGKNKVDVQIDADGIYLKKCILEYRLSEDKFQGYLKIDLGVFVDLLKKNIRELIRHQVSIVESEFGLNLDLHGYNIKEIGTVPICFPVIKNKLFIEEEFTPEASELSNYNRNDYLNFQAGAAVDVDNSLNQGSHVVPQVFLTWLLKELAGTLNLTPTGEVLSDPELKTWIILNNVAADLRMDDRTRYDINIYQHLPDITFADLLKALRKDESIGAFIDLAAGTMEFKRLTETIVDSTIVDLNGSELVGWQNQIQEADGYNIRANISDKDEMYKLTRHKSSFQVATAAKEIDLSFGTLLMTKETHPTNGGPTGIGDWLVPEIRMAGNLLNDDYTESVNFIEEQSREDFKPKNETPLLLLSYRGIQYGSGALAYALATSTQYNARNEIVGTRCTRFDSSTGRFYSSLERFYGFLAKSIPIEANILVPVAKLPSIKLNSKIRLKFENAARHYLITRSRINFPVNNGKVEMQLILAQISLRDVVTQQATTPGIDIYLVLSLENDNYINENMTDKDYADVVIRAYSDASLSDPLTVSDLTVYYKSTDSDNVTEEFTAVMSGSSITVQSQVLYRLHQYDYQDNTLQFYQKNFELMPSESYNS